jgi:hypothetical protein
MSAMRRPERAASTMVFSGSADPPAEVTASKEPRQSSMLASQYQPDMAGPADWDSVEESLSPLFAQLHGDIFAAQCLSRVVPGGAL